MTTSERADLSKRIESLASRLANDGYLTDPVWRRALFAVPRHLFIPEAIWDEADAPIVRAEDPGGWLERVYSDELIVTQLDDGTTKPGKAGGYYSSSSSMPSVMMRMLSELEVREGMRVLEIGTGTGWNAGLLAYRLGAASVTTVEIDPAVAAHAAEALAGAGYHPTVVTGDGAEGHPRHAPYDRVLSTASVQLVPYPWVDQTSPGGLIVTPWGTPYYNGALAKLKVSGDGTASGPIVGTSAFMWLRNQRIPFRYLDQVHTQEKATETVTELHPYEPVSDHDAAFTVGVLVPGCQLTVTHADDGPQNYVLWLMHPASGSWASLTHEPDAEAYPVRQHGPRMLWDEVETAYQWWVDAGRPSLTRFGLTITPDGQWVWLDEPGKPVAAVEPTRT